MSRAKNPKATSDSRYRWAIGIILIIVGINALGGGYYGAVAGAPNVPLEWLSGTPFKNYFIPSLILAFVVGGSSLFAAVIVFLQRPSGKRASTIASAILLIWIFVQVAMIGFVSWLQPLMASAAIITFLLSRKLQSSKANNFATKAEI